MTPQDNSTPEAQTKICLECGIPKSLDLFHRYKKSKDGHVSYCKECVSRKTRIYYNENKDHVKKQASEWAKGNKDKKKRTNAKYNSKNKKYYQDWIAAKKEIDPEYRKKVTRRNYLKSRDKKAAYQNKWQKENPDKNTQYVARRRALRLNAPINDFTPEQWLALQIFYDHRCAYCKKKFKGKLSQDHITPLTKGGSHTLSNIVPACKSCNSSKSTGDPLCPVQPLLIVVGK